MHKFSPSDPLHRNSGLCSVIGTQPRWVLMMCYTATPNTRRIAWVNGVTKTDKDKNPALLKGSIRTFLPSPCSSVFLAPQVPLTPKHEQEPRGCSSALLPTQNHLKRFEANNFPTSWQSSQYKLMIQDLTVYFDSPHPCLLYSHFHRHNSFPCCQRWMLFCCLSPDFFN